VITGTFDAGTAIIDGYTIDKAEQPLDPTDTVITVSYTENGVTKTTAITITVAPKTLQGIRIATQPTKVSYIEGAVFDPAGMVVTANYEYIGVLITDYTVSKTTALSVSDTAVTIGYTESGVTKTAVVTITVAEKSLQGLTVTEAPATTAYVEGQLFSSDGLVVTADYEHSSKIITDYSINKTSPLMPSDVAVTISYTENGMTKTATVAIAVTPKTLQSITVQTPPTRMAYIEGEVFDAAGLSIVANYEYLSEAVTDYAADKTGRLLPADTSVTISFTHGGVTKTEIVAITVAPKTLQNIAVTALPVKISYVEGQAFDSTGMVITAVYEFVSVVITDYEIAVASVLMLGNEAVTIGYTDGGIIKTATFILTINRKTLQGLTVTVSPSKLSYIEGEIFSVSGLVLTADYEYLNYIVTNYSFDKTAPFMPADSAVTFSYTDNGVTKTVAVNIAVAQRTLQSIEITNLPGTTNLSHPASTFYYRLSFSLSALQI
jgi:hypothetical protein